MKKEYKVLLVLLILVFSIVPIYFFINPDENQIPFNNSDNSTLIKPISANLSAGVKNIEPKISFVGNSPRNDNEYINLVRSEVNRIGYRNCSTNNENCTFRVFLNPYGSGYRYEVFMTLKNESDADYVGFRLSYLLNYYLNTSSPELRDYATVIGVVELVEPFTADGVKYEQSNITGPAILSYSNKKNRMVKLYCPDLVTTSNKVLQVSSYCVDRDLYLKYGLNALTVIANQEYFNKTMSFNVSFDELYFTADGNITDSIVGNLSFAKVMTTADSSSILVRTANLSKADEIKTILSGFTIKEQYKIATVQLPETIKLDDGKDYKILGGKVTLKMPLSQIAGVQNVKLQVRTLYDEVIEITAL